MLDKDSEEYKAWNLEEYNASLQGSSLDAILARMSTVECLLVDIFGALGYCSAINNGVFASNFATRFARSAEDLKKISDRLVESGDNFEQALNVAIEVFQNEIEIIGKWTQSAKTVNDNIDQYPVELLSMVKSIRTIFVTGLDNLKKAAEDFLAQPKYILTLEN